MPIPARFRGRLSIPAVAAPMFLVSNPDLVVECCRAGILGTFPALNNRSSEAYEGWLVEITERLARIEHDTGRPCAPYGVNLIVHKSNPRLQADLALSIKHKVPLIITSLGAVKELVGAVQGYGGLVFHDVINMRHARKAAEAGVDGLIAVCAGAGGHAGLLSPFALIPEIRRFFDKTILLSGVMSTGRHVAAARMLGADLAYLGTRFIATREHGAAGVQGHDRWNARGRHRLHGGDQRRARQLSAAEHRCRGGYGNRPGGANKKPQSQSQKPPLKKTWGLGGGG